MKNRFSNATLYKSMALSTIAFSASISISHAQVLEEVVVVAEKRNESLQDLSQAVTALSRQTLDDKNIVSFVDLSGIAPGITIAKNEGFKTVIAIRGVGNEANQNAVANPSVSYHIDGIYIASPFSLQTDFIGVDRIEALRGPQGTLFGQNSTGGAINVISQKPTSDEFSGKADLTLGEHNLVRVRGSVNLPLSDSVSTRTSISSFEHDGFSNNILNGQELDDANNLSFRSDWLWNINDTSSIRVFAQLFEEDSNGAAIKGIFDPTPDPRQLAQDTVSSYDLESEIYGLIAETDIGVATLKYLGSYQKDDITVVRDNDRHSVALNPEIQISEFDPERNVQTTTTHEINLVSNQPIGGKLDWIVGAFYLDTEVDITIREELDTNFNGVLDGFVSSFPAVFGGDIGFISDALPTRESLSVYGQTTYYFNDVIRLITGLRYTEDDVESAVSNFFQLPANEIAASVSETTGRIALEYDINDSTLLFGSFTRGFKPGGSNLTFGFLPGEFDFIAGGIDNSAPLVFPTFEDETINAFEIGLKTEFLDGRFRANIAAFLYDYENIQFQATDPNAFQGGVANIPESEIFGAELELLGFITDKLSLDAKMAVVDTEITSDFFALDNVLAAGLGFAPGQDVTRAALAENVNGNELAKTPGFTADISLSYRTEISNGASIGGILQYTYRDSFQQRIFNNPDVDFVNSYNLVSTTLSYTPADAPWAADFIVTNLFDEDGVNSRMTDVFGVNATGEERVAPRQIMARVRLDF